MTVPADLDRRFRDAAVQPGSSTPATTSSTAPLARCSSPRRPRAAPGLLRRRSPSRRGSEQIARVAGPRVLRAPRAVDVARAELDEYFAGRRRAFDLPVDLRGQPGFAVSVLAELAKVPYGHTQTYGELASRAGTRRRRVRSAW